MHRQGDRAAPTIGEQKFKEKVERHCAIADELFFWYPNAAVKCHCFLSAFNWRFPGAKRKGRKAKENECKSCDRCELHNVHQGHIQSLVFCLDHLYEIWWNRHEICSEKKTWAETLASACWIRQMSEAATEKVPRISGLLKDEHHGKHCMLWGCGSLKRNCIFWQSWIQVSTQNYLTNESLNKAYLT